MVNQVQKNAIIRISLKRYGRSIGAKFKKDDRADVIINKIMKKLKK